MAVHAANTKKKVYEVNNFWYLVNFICFFKKS